MKKSSNIRFIKKGFNSPSESYSVIHLNKSGSSAIDFTNLSSHNHKESSFDPILSTDQKLKPRKHTKAPSKRLALLLDAYSERNPRRQNLTMENLEVSSRENSSLRSPKNVRNSTEITKKPLGLKQVESAANLKSFDALKSIEITKVGAYQELLRNNVKSQRHESESIQRQIQGRQDAQVGARGQNEESSLMKQLEKKLDKSVGKKRNDVSAKRAALRKTKVLQSDMSVPFLNSSQPHSTKHQQQAVSTSLNFSNYTNSAVSLLNKIMANTQEKCKKTSSTSGSSQVRSPSNLRESTTTTAKAQYGNYFSTASTTTAPKREEKSGSATRKIDDLKKSGVKLGISLPIKDIQLNHHKGISMITTKHNTETDRELLTHTSQEPPLTSIQSAKKRNSPTAREILLSFSNKKQASQESGSLVKLEKAFDVFLEENRVSLGQQKIDKIAKAWSLFTETVKTIEGGPSIHRLESSARKDREAGLKKSAQSVSTNYTEKKGKEDLTTMLDKQQQQIEAMKKKEDSMLQMILNIKSKAAEIEKDQEKEYGDTIVSLQAPEDDSILSQSMDLMSSNPNYLGLPIYKSCSDAKSTTDNTPYPLILGQKNVPKLDLTTLSTNNNSNKITSNGGMGSGNGNGSKGFKLDLKGISAENATVEDRPGFHEEFMAKIDEFSHSWRQEALNQRDYIDG